MKLKIISRFLFLGLLAILALMPQSGCNKFENITDGVKIIIDYNLIKTTIDVQLVDASTGNLVGHDGSISVKATITGEDRDGLIDITGMQHNDYVYMSQNGFLSLGLQPNTAYTPSESNPISFNIVVEHDGYLATSQHIVITNEGRNFVVIKMVNLEQPPSGVSVIQQPNAGSSNGSGMVESEIIVTTADGKASLTIPEGIVIKDVFGNPLQGSLNVILVHFDNTDPEALAAFPGGLTTNVTRIDGSSEDGMFYSAGFVAIEISDESGRIASTFTNGVLTLKAEVSAQTYNPETQAQVLSGDDIQLWSYDELTGMWKEESTITVTETDGKLHLETPLTHLSYYNFDWFYSENCASGVAIYFNLDQPVCDCYMMYGTMYRQADNAYMKTVSMWVCGTDPVYTSYVPSGVPVYIDWNEEINNLSVVNNPTYIQNLCDVNTPVYVEVSNPTPTSSITIDVEAYCASNPDVVIRPSFGAYFRTLDSYNWRYAEMTNGYANICDVTVGETYVVGVYFENTWYETEVTVEQSEYSYVGFELPADVCSEVFGM
ncbi:MAG: hypothetical protein ACOYMF_18665 [Bacteroidales bacterium]